MTLTLLSRFPPRLAVHRTRPLSLLQPRPRQRLLDRLLRHLGRVPRGRPFRAVIWPSPLTTATTRPLINLVWMRLSWRHESRGASVEVRVGKGDGKRDRHGAGGGV